MTKIRYRKSSHTVYDCKYHLVWTTKYRYRVMDKKVGQRVRDLIREICREHDVEIVKGHVTSGHEVIFVRRPEWLEKIRSKTT